MSDRFGSYAEFWPHYLHQHSRPGTRALHVTGTVLGFGMLVPLVATGSPCSALAGIAIGYGLAWVAHFLVEGNRPAAFGHPLWSLYSDLRMTGLALTRRLAPELERHGVA